VLLVEFKLLLPTNIIAFSLNVEHQDNDLEDFRTCAVVLAAENNKVSGVLKQVFISLCSCSL
jgi:hypothetical protein